MNTQLKEKMQQAAKEYASFPADAHIKKARYMVESQSRDFIAGASAMYAELAQLVEWVSVEERLPEKDGYYLVKVEHSFPNNCNALVAEFYEDDKTFYSENDCTIDDVTHWRRIEL